MHQIPGCNRIEDFGKQSEWSQAHLIWKSLKFLAKKDFLIFRLIIPERTNLIRIIVNQKFFVFHVRMVTWVKKWCEL